MLTDDEWDSIALVMDKCWKGHFDDETAMAYRMMLAPRFEASQILAALNELAESGSPFLPAVPEIVQTARKMQEPELPSWSEVFAGIDKGIRFQSQQASLDWISENVHPVVAKFVVAEGWETLRMTPFFDPDYGALRQRDLKARWESFVEVAKERLARGRALEAVTGRRGIGPARLDMAALLEDARPEQGALPSGDGGTIDE